MKKIFTPPKINSRMPASALITAKFKFLDNGIEKIVSNSIKIGFLTAVCAEVNATALFGETQVAFYHLFNIQGAENAENDFTYSRFARKINFLCVLAPACA